MGSSHHDGHILPPQKSNSGLDWLTHSTTISRLMRTGPLFTAGLVSQDSAQLLFLHDTIYDHDGADDLLTQILPVFIICQQKVLAWPAAILAKLQGPNDAMIASLHLFFFTMTIRFRWLLSCCPYHGGRDSFTRRYHSSTGRGLVFAPTFTARPCVRSRPSGERHWTLWLGDLWKDILGPPRVMMDYD